MSDPMAEHIRAYCDVAEAMMAHAAAQTGKNTAELVIGGAAVALAYTARVMRVPVTDVLDDVRKLTMGFYDSGGDVFRDGG
jgi:hypothetical protein